MEIRTLSGPVMPDEESAKAAMKGIIEGLGKDGDFEITSLEAHEADGGGWVAVLIVRMLDPEPEEGEEKGGTEESGNREKMPAEDDSEFLLLHGHLGKNEVMENSGADVFPDEDEIYVGDAPPEAPDILAEAEREIQEKNYSEPPDEIAEAAKESVESLTEEFQEAETGEMASRSDGVTEYALFAAQNQRLEELRRIQTLSEQELIEMAEEEEKLRLAADYAANHMTDAPVPDPAQSA